jgi:hypothetical protein
LGSDTLAAVATVLAVARWNRENFMMVAMRSNYGAGVWSFKAILMPSTTDR